MFFQVVYFPKNPITERQRMMIGVSHHLRNAKHLGSMKPFSEGEPGFLIGFVYSMCLRFREIDSHDSSDLSEPFGLKEKFGDVDSSGQRKQPNCRMKQLPNETVSYRPPWRSWTETLVQPPNELGIFGVILLYQCASSCTLLFVKNCSSHCCWWPKLAIQVFIGLDHQIHSCF